ncbi:MAG: MotA/TolQ/ExbB proton channel family protein [Candidatus Adiutrix sp.]|jgi:biopolymer transport protein ExbB|nr:MotA/TolQ/ExbB proton channel family protein [Candidatus Adiutrix sp.]
MQTMELWSRFYALIGPAGLTLVVLAAAALFLAVKNILFLWLVGRDFHRAALALGLTPENRDGLLLRFAGNPIIAIIDGIIRTHGQHSYDLKAEVAYLFHRHFSRAQRDITCLRVIAVVSPLLGLLGTLLGLLGVFQTLAQTTTAAVASILAAGIWEAIITTIMGLTLAIPCLMVYYLLSLKLRSFHLAAIEYGYRFLECRPHCPAKAPAQHQEGAGLKTGEVRAAA